MTLKLTNTTFPVQSRIYSFTNWRSDKYAGLETTYCEWMLISLIYCGSTRFPHAYYNVYQILNGHFGKVRRFWLMTWSLLWPIHHKYVSAVPSSIEFEYLFILFLFHLYSMYVPYKSLLWAFPLNSNTKPISLSQIRKEK